MFTLDQKVAKKEKWNRLNYVPNKLSCYYVHGLISEKLNFYGRWNLYCKIYNRAQYSMIYNDIRCAVLWENYHICTYNYITNLGCFALRKINHFKFYIRKICYNRLISYEYKTCIKQCRGKESKACSYLQ